MTRGHYGATYDATACTAPCRDGRSAPPPIAGGPPIGMRILKIGPPRLPRSTAHALSRIDARKLAGIATPPVLNYSHISAGDRVNQLGEANVPESAPNIIGNCDLAIRQHCLGFYADRSGRTSQSEQRSHRLDNTRHTDSVDSRGHQNALNQSPAHA